MSYGSRHPLHTDHRYYPREDSQQITIVTLRNQITLYAHYEMSSNKRCEARYVTTGGLRQLDVQARHVANFMMKTGLLGQFRQV
jgi:hypothetical protein